MSSLRSKALAGLAKLTKTKIKFNQLQQNMAEGRWKRVRRPPTPKQFKKYAISCTEMDGHAVWSFSRRHSVSKTHVLYLHGGGYFNGLAPEHWAFVAHLVDQIDCTLIVPDYPLAPEFSVTDAFPMLLSVYQALCSQVGHSQVTLMGESAGAGLCLVLAQGLLEEHLPQPKQILLLSPWLDVSMTNPDIASVDEVDPVLGVTGLTYAGNLFAGALDPQHPRVSPLYGRLRGLAPITLFIGTHDVLLPDCRRLQLLAKEQGIVLDYHEFPEMLHIWMFLPIPEARPVIATIIEKLQAKVSATQHLLPQSA